MDLRTWIAGLISALSGAVAAALGLLVADPQAFNFDTGLRKIVIVCLFTATVSLLNYLKQSPLPGSKGKIPMIAYILIPLFLLAGPQTQGCAPGATGPDAATAKGLQWYQDIQNWTPYQKANFFMDTWQSENATYKAQNAIEKKTETLIALLKVKREVLENSRIPIRMYVSLVKAGGKPDQDIEQQIIAWVRQLQTQALQGIGGK